MKDMKGREAKCLNRPATPFGWVDLLEELRVRAGSVRDSPYHTSLATGIDRDPTEVSSDPTHAPWHSLPHKNKTNETYGNELRLQSFTVGELENLHRI